MLSFGYRLRFFAHVSFADSFFNLRFSSAELLAHPINSFWMTQRNSASQRRNSSERSCSSSRWAVLHDKALTTLHQSATLTSHPRANCSQPRSWLAQLRAEDHELQQDQETLSSIGQTIRLRIIWQFYARRAQVKVIQRFPNNS